MTPSVISAVDTAAKADVVKKTVIRSKHSQIFYDSSWIAGGEYTNNFNDDDVYADSDYGTEDADDEDLIADDISEDEIHALQQEENERSPIQDEQQFDPKIKEVEPEQVEPKIEQVKPRRSSRTRQLTEKLRDLGKQYAQSAVLDHEWIELIQIEYEMEARVIATIMCLINERMHVQTKVTEHQHVVTYSLTRAIKKFGELAKQSAHGKMKQLHDRKCFQAIYAESLSDVERKRALELLLFVVEKKSELLKSRHCANGNPQRQWMDREEVSSQTVSTEALFIRAAINAAEGGDVATCDIPTAFIQTDLNEDKDGHWTIMKIQGVLVDIQVTPGKMHEHLGMKLDFSRKGQVMIDMRDYVETMRQAFPQEELVSKKVSSPWNYILFKVDEKASR
jgi:hypothetical protein